MTPRPARVRLVALDLDGTLLRSDGSVSDRTRAALQATREAGVAVVLVTARPPRRLRAITAQTRVRGLAICSNGAVIYDLDRDCIEHQTSIPHELACALVRKLRSLLPDVAFAVEAGARYGCELHYVVQTEHAHDAADPAMLRADAVTLCSLGATKLIVQHGASELSELLRTVSEHADALPVTHSGSNFIEVTAPRITKAAALAWLCERHGISAGEVIAFGDMPNDLPMLTWAGHAVAVANAHAQVLAAAETITATNDDDGVARILELLARRDWSSDAWDQ